MARRTHHEGLPVYRYSDTDGALATGQIASRTELRRRRRRPADDQPVVGYTWFAKQWVALYTTADAEPLPDLSPIQQSRYEHARTCARCSAVSDPDPWKNVAHRGEKPRRLCPDCYLFERYAHWRTRQFGGRLAATAWAREALADLSVAIVAAIPDPLAGAVAVHARDIDGQVLLDVLLRRRINPGMGVSGLDVIERLTALGMHRVIGDTAYHIDWYADACGSTWNDAGMEVTTWPRKIAASERDSIVARQGQWLMQPMGGALGSAVHAYQPRIEFAGTYPPGSTGPAVEHVDLVFAALQRIAGGVHPDGDICCPLPAEPTGREICRAPLAMTAAGPAGTCERHAAP